MFLSYTKKRVHQDSSHQENPADFFSLKPKTILSYQFIDSSVLLTPQNSFSLLKEYFFLCCWFFSYFFQPFSWFFYRLILFDLAKNCSSFSNLFQTGDLKVWSPEQQQQHQLGTFQKNNFWCPISDILNYKLKVAGRNVYFNK